MLRQSRVFLLFVSLFTVFLGIVPAAAQDAGNGKTIDVLNVRSGPDTQFPIVTEIGAQVSIVIEGRNTVGNWVLIHTPDGAIRGWVASRFVQFGEGVILDMLPVTEEITGPGAPPPAANNPPPAEQNTAPPPPTGGAGSGTTIDVLNVRSGPDTEHPVLTQVGARVGVAIEGRNAVGNWVLIHTPDGAIRGWVASRYIQLDEGVSLDLLPVTGETVGSAPPPAANNPPPAEQNAAPAPAGSATGQTLAQLNVRIGPGTEFDTIIQIGAGANVVIEGRNAIGNWVLIHSGSGSTRGWVASRYIQFGAGISLEGLPVSTEIIGVDPDEAEFPNLPPIPTENDEAMLARLMSTPVLHNFFNNTLIAIFDRGKELGNNPRVFMKVGDSVTATQPFLIGFGNNNYNLGSYGYLQEAINFFSVSPRPGALTSFDSASIAAQSGFTSSAVFDGLWVNPAVCNEGPLYCEYNYIKPSVAIILFGPVDMRSSAVELFNGNMYKMAKHLIDRGVIPVMTTFANHPDYMWHESLLFNTIILNVARDYNLPVINLFRATQELPDYGIRLNDPIHLSQGPTYYSFNGEETLYGVTLRNLLTLQALEELRRNVLTR